MSQLDSSLSQLNWLINKSTEEKEVSEKPKLSYSQLIKMAIENAPEGRCTLSEIYAYISANFPYYRTHANRSWKNSIRHNLSLNKQFVRESRSSGDAGKGSYWRCVPPNETVRMRRFHVDEGAEGPRLNPALEKFLEKSASETELPPQPSTSECTNGTKRGSANADSDEDEDDVSDIDLFRSMNLSASFRDLYEQMFSKSKPTNHNGKISQIDWLKASLQHVGVDCENDEDINNVDMDRFKKFVGVNGLRDSLAHSDAALQRAPIPEDPGNCAKGLRVYDANCSLNELNKDLSIINTSSLQTPMWTADDEDSDEFDWELLINK